MSTLPAGKSPLPAQPAGKPASNLDKDLNGLTEIVHYFYQQVSNNLK